MAFYTDFDLLDRIKKNDNLDDKLKQSIYRLFYRTRAKQSGQYNEIPTYHSINSFYIEMISYLEFEIKVYTYFIGIIFAFTFFTSITTIYKINILGFNQSLITQHPGLPEPIVDYFFQILDLYLLEMIISILWCVFIGFAFVHTFKKIGKYLKMKEKLTELRALKQE